MFLQFPMGKNKLGGECHVKEGMLITDCQNPRCGWWCIAFQRWCEQNKDDIRAIFVIFAACMWWCGEWLCYFFTHLALSAIYSRTKCLLTHSNGLHCLIKKCCLIPCNRCSSSFKTVGIMKCEYFLYCHSFIMDGSFQRSAHVWGRLWKQRFYYLLPGILLFPSPFSLPPLAWN